MSGERLYVAGPMSGYPGYNREAFDQAEVDLELAGFEVLNPARRDQSVERSWADWMRLGLTDVLAAEGVAVLPGWEASRGAVLEVRVAQGLGVPVLPVVVWLARARDEERRRARRAFEQGVPS